MLQMSWKTNIIFLEQSWHWTGFTSIFVTDTLVIFCDTSGHCYTKSWTVLLGGIAATTVIKMVYQCLNRQQNIFFPELFIGNSKML